jgi:hypothetical protein
LADSCSLFKTAFQLFYPLRPVITFEKQLAVTIFGNIGKLILVIVEFDLIAIGKDPDKRRKTSVASPQDIIIGDIVAAFSHPAFYPPDALFW